MHQGPDREGLGWIGFVGLTVTAIAATALLWTRRQPVSAAARARPVWALLHLGLLRRRWAHAADVDELPGATDIRGGDYYSLVLFSTVRHGLMATATDLIVIFLGLEVMSIAAYVIAGIWRSECVRTKRR